MINETRQNPVIKSKRAELGGVYKEAYSGKIKFRLKKMRNRYQL